MNTARQPRLPCLRPEPLTREAFAPFGEVIEATDEAHHYLINAGNTIRYHDLARIQPGDRGRVIVSIFRGEARQLPFTVTMMERHPLASQAFMPLSGRPYLIVVAPADTPPRVSDLRLFVARADQGVNYAAGVWHHPLLALEATSDFLVIDRAGSEHNCDEIDLAQPALIDLLATATPPS